ARRRDRVRPVFELALGFEQVGCATAVSKPTMVEDEREVSALCKSLGERTEPVPPRSRQSMGHHDYRIELLGTVVPRVVHPRGTHVAADFELQIDSVHGDANAKRH